MSRPGGDPAVPDRQARGHRGMPAGLLEKLMAAVRPEFRADDLVFDPRDPVFGGAACVVGGCSRVGATAASFSQRSRAAVSVTVAMTCFLGGDGSG